MTFIIILLIAVKLLVITVNLIVIGIVIDSKNYNTQDFYNLVIPTVRAPP